jgi:ABC-type multidrug transport system fused ATPase/permease subunit
MKEFIRKLVEIYKPFKRAMLGVFGFIFLTQALGLISPYLQGKVIDGLIGGKPFGQILLVVAAILAVIFLKNVFISCWRERYEIKRIDFSVFQHVNRKTLERLLSFSIGQHISENSGIKQSVITRGQHSLTSLAYMLLYDFLPMIIEVVLLVGILSYYSKTLGLIVLSGIAAYVSFTVYVNFKFRDDLKNLEKMFNENSKFQGEILQNIELVMVNSQEPKAVRECDNNLNEISVFGRSLWSRFSLFVATRNIIVGITRVSVLGVGAFLTYKGNYTVGQLVMFFSWSGEALGQVYRVGSLHRQMLQLYASVKKYFDMLDMEPDVVVLPNPVHPERFQGKIEFRNVTFSYKRRDAIGDEDEKDGSPLILLPQNPALQNVSFVIESGQRVAIVGESGAGKSTIAHVLLRAQDPQEGQVIIDGNDLRIIDLKHFRESVGVVDQQVSLFDNTLRYNITFGLNGRSASITDADLDRIAEMSCVNRFFPRLEKGYDTIIGERGVKLSGGERQRIGIARALIKEPDILIFDEATSNLDSENEFLIRESIEKASRGRTTIIIAHRFSTIKKVDKVIVFEKGRVVGEGTHGELSRNCEPYCRLIRNQMM